MVAQVAYVWTSFVYPEVLLLFKLQFFFSLDWSENLTADGAECFIIVKGPNLFYQLISLHFSDFLPTELDEIALKGGEEINPRVYQTVQHMGNAVHEFDTTFNALNA